MNMGEDFFSDSTPAHTEFKPGVYEHYKGGRYRALMLVDHHETREKMVVYVSLSYGTVNVRELNQPPPQPLGRRAVDAWTDSVQGFDGHGVAETRPRFRYVGP
jgi:hypothetical protein